MHLPKARAKLNKEATRNLPLKIFCVVDFPAVEPLFFNLLYELDLIGIGYVYIEEIYERGSFC